MTMLSRIGRGTRVPRMAGATVLGLGLALGGCVDSGTGTGLELVSEQQVETMGVQAWQQLTAEEPPSDEPAMHQRAERVANDVLRAAGENPAEWDVVVFESNELNAFALPGGKIGVYEGMMRFAENDALLAAVLAHEVAHNKANHGTERVNSQMAAKLGVDLASVALGAADVADPRAIAQILGAGAQYGVLLPYSRNQEFEADTMGLGYMAQAGYDPRAAVEMWQRMKASGGGQPPVFMSTHPHPDQRIARLREHMPKALSIYEQNR